MMSQERNTEGNSDKEKKGRKLGPPSPEKSPEIKEEKRKLRLERRTDAHTMGSRRPIKRTQSGIPLDGSGKKPVEQANEPEVKLPKPPEATEKTHAETEGMPDLNNTAIPFRMAFHSKQSPRYKDSNSKGIPQEEEEKVEIKPPPPPPPKHSHYLLKTPKPFNEPESMPGANDEEGEEPPVLPPEALLPKSNGGNGGNRVSKRVLPIIGMIAVLFVVIAGIVMIGLPFLKDEKAGVSDTAVVEEAMTELKKLTGEFDKPQQPVASKSQGAKTQPAQEGAVPGVALEQQPNAVTADQVLNSKAVQSNIGKAQEPASAAKVQEKASQMGVSAEKLQEAVSAAKNGSTAKTGVSAAANGVSQPRAKETTTIELSEHEFNQQVIQEKAAEMGVSEAELKAAIADVLASEQPAEASAAGKPSNKLVNGQAEKAPATESTVKAVQVFKAGEENTLGVSDRLPYAKIKKDKATQEVVTEAAEDVFTGPDPVLATWLEGVKITSVIFKGDSSRMILDGKIFYLGAVVNPRGELRWVKVHASKHELYFQDEFGNIYLKRQ